MSIKVLIVDDSALFRHVLTDMLQGAPEITVVGTAADPYEAREKIKTLNPDVVTLDIEMPRMDGLAFLERLMALRPMPAIVISTLTQKGTDKLLRALEIGAVDVIAKPLMHTEDSLDAMRAELIDKVRMAVLARPRSRPAAPVGPAEAPQRTAGQRARAGIVAVGASTGGVEAVQRLLCDLPADSPPILVTQHMPAGFTASFAQRMDRVCRMTVCEAAQHQPILPGHVYIAPGNWHLTIAKTSPAAGNGAHYLCCLDDGPAVSGHRPSVDVLFRSMAATAGADALGIILTGMGRDGAAGLLAMRSVGARTVGQSEASCLIYGMPKAAKDIGGVCSEMALGRMGAEILG